MRLRAPWLAAVAIAGTTVACEPRPLAPSPVAPAAPPSVPPTAMPTAPPHPAPATFVTANDPRVAVMGRVFRLPDGGLRFGYPGVTLRVALTGSGLTARAACSTGNCRLAVTVDAGPARVVRLPARERDVELAAGLGPGTHVVELVHRTETWQGIVTVRGLVLPAGATLETPPPWPERRLLFIGDSITCGEGADRAAMVPGDKAASSDGTRSFGMLVAQELGAQCHLVCFGGRGIFRDWQGRRDVLNAPRFAELALPSEADPVPWDHREYAPNVVVVSLGTNDFNLDLGALPTEADFVAPYVTFVRTLLDQYPQAKVLLTEGAIVNDAADPARPQKTVLARHLAETVRRVADARVVFVPSQHYPGDASDAHPTGEQQAAIARDLAGPIAALAGW